MENAPGQWMAEQQQAGRRLCLVLQGESDARGVLLATRTVPEYRSLYGETVASEMAADGPMLLLLDHVNEPGLVGLLQNPQRNWGWLGSLPGDDLSGVTRHWRDRLVVGRRAVRRCTASTITAPWRGPWFTCLLGTGLFSRAADQRVLLAG